MRIKKIFALFITVLTLCLAAAPGMHASAAATAETVVTFGPQRQRPISTDGYADFKLTGKLYYSRYTSSNLVITKMRTEITNYNDDHEFENPFFQAQDVYQGVSTDTVYENLFLNGPIPAGATNFVTMVDWKEVCENVGQTNSYHIGGNNFVQTHIGLKNELYMGYPYYYFFETNWLSDGYVNQYIVG